MVVRRLVEFECVAIRSVLRIWESGSLKYKISVGVIHSQSHSCMARRLPPLPPRCSKYAAQKLTQADARKNHAKCQPAESNPLPMFHFRRSPKPPRRRSHYLFESGLAQGRRGALARNFPVARLDRQSVEGVTHTDATVLKSNLAKPQRGAPQRGDSRVLAPDPFLPPSSQEPILRFGS